ncbi:hypothetical protein E4S40_15895 [Algoriphagus kandeliae]|uniref:Uncharacterized protein n=1 Tax=Algoriphagus kandeliae TaxID=2562278 RepID=A0A4Y9QMZ9_9BACT|nr:hypothetical protein [Algoriphagus kandeliae]TFV92326.1 hypothetical protein E4S40_15895 [Algoriphagus kandeliae]
MKVQSFQNDQEIGKYDQSLEDLSQKVPLTGEELKKKAPINIGSFSQVDLVIGSQEEIGISSIQSIYQHVIENNKFFTLEIMDGAGESGIIFLKQSLEKLKSDFDPVTSKEEIFIREHQGFRILEKQLKEMSQIHLEFILAKRFLVKVRSENLSKEELTRLVHLLPTWD